MRSTPSSYVLHLKIFVVFFAYKVRNSLTMHVGPSIQPYLYGSDHSIFVSVSHKQIRPSGWLSMNKICDDFVP